MSLDRNRTAFYALFLAALLVFASSASAWAEWEHKGVMRVDLNRLYDYFSRYDTDNNGVLSFPELMAFYYEAAALPVYPNGEYKFYPSGWAQSKQSWGHYQWAWGFANPAYQTFGLTKEAVRNLLYHFRTYDQNHTDGLDPQEMWIAVNALGVESKIEGGNKPYAPDWAGYKGAGPGQGGAYPAGLEHYKTADPSYWDTFFADPNAGLTRKDISGLIADFYTIDVDQDYHLNPMEIERYTHPKDPEPPAWKFQLIISRKDLFNVIKDFNTIDNDKNGILSYPEMLSYMHHLPPPNRWGPWSSPWVADPAFGATKGDIHYLHNHFSTADCNKDKYLSPWEYWGFIHTRYNWRHGWCYPGASVYWGTKYPWDHPAAKGPQFALAENDIQRLDREFDRYDANHDNILQLGELAEALKTFASTYSENANMLEVHPYVPYPGSVHYPY